MSIAVVGMLDEREEALGFLKQRIQQRGHHPLLLDTSIGVGGTEPSLRPDVTNSEISRAGGLDPGELKALASMDREKVTEAMSRGLSKILLELHLSHRIRGAVAVGGMTTSTIALPALKALPFGVPKLLVSSAMAMPAYAGKFSQFLGLRDITVMHTVVDTVGMNPLVRTLMNNACGLICGMVDNWEAPRADDRSAVALTELGFCDRGAQLVRELLTGRNYSVVSFHATGMGDRAAEDLVAQGFFQGFVDLVPAGLSEHILGGNRDAGPERLTGAVKAAVPYVLAPCGFDMLSCGPLERKDKGDPLWVQRGIAQRKLLVQDAMRVQARTTPQEMAMVAEAVAQRLNQHPRKQWVRFIIPNKGFSSLSVEGGPLYDPEADETFTRSLREHLDPGIEIVEVEAHVNEPAFAREVVNSLEELMNRARA